MTTGSRRFRRFLVAASLVALAAAPDAVAQEQSLSLTDNCTVSILNRNAIVSPGGAWIIPNVPANFGLVRARASCLENGITRFGESAPFLVPSDGDVDVPPIALGPTTPIPQIMTLTASTQTLGAPGATAQVTVQGVFAGNVSRNLTGSATGTTYTSSNPAIATIDAEGLVRAVTSGAVIIQATNEGASGLLSVRVVLSADSDGDGIPDDVELREGLDPNNPADGLEDFDRDGLSNRDEVEAGTGIRVADTDGDGILDGEELVPGTDGFVTSALLADTDGDGVRDALEIETGSDPTDRNSLNLAAAMTDLVVTPASFTLLVNTLVGEAYTQLRILGSLRDGTSIDLTSTTRGTTYASSDLTICNFGSPDGRVYGANEGGCTITVANAGFSGSVHGTVRTFSPLPVAQVAIPGYANNVEVSNGFAFVAAGSAGLQVVSVSDPANPVIVGSRDTAGVAIDVRVVGRYAYVADGGAGLAIIDVINPASPVIVGVADTPGDAQDVVVANNIAYVADGWGGLTLVNVASPNSPIVAGSLSIGTQARGVDVADNLAVVVGDGGAFRIVNVSNPAAPAIVGSLQIAGAPKDVRISGTLAYTAAYTGGVSIVDFATPGSPVWIGGLPGSAPNGFVPRDVELAGAFAIFAEQLFPNAVPFVDVTVPSNPLLKGIINFSPLGDYAGTGIAVSGPFVYMTGEYYVVGSDYGSNGNTRLFVGQYLPLEDLAGVPPSVTIAAPAEGEVQYEGAQLTVVADATDDVAIAQVRFSIGGEVVFVDASAPYEYTFQVPSGFSTLSLSVVAADLGGNEAAVSRQVPVVPDPLTTVSGIVVDRDGAPLVGATVTTTDDRTGLTGPGGAFSIFGVPTVLGPIVANVRFTEQDGDLLTGSSLPIDPNRGGVTDVGTITAIAAQWETDIGTFVTSCDDCNYRFTLPFPFPFYGVTRTEVFVGTNGYLTFGSGDNTYSENLTAFNNRPRIAPLFDDLYGRSTGGLYVNASLPDRFIVTHKTVQHFSWGGSNTLQIVLYADGRIQFGYDGITALTTGAITGLTPGPQTPFVQLDFSATRAAEVPADTAVYEYFTSTNPFDMDGGFILFAPRGDGGYSVRTTLPSTAQATVELSGAPSGVEAEAEPARGDLTIVTQGQNVFARAEVEVTSSRNRTWKANTNTDGRGTFRLRNVPPGGINVVLRKRGEIVGTGAAVFTPGPGKSNRLHVTIEAPSTAPKTQAE